MNRHHCDVNKTTKSTRLTGDAWRAGCDIIAGVAHSCLRGWRLSMEDEVVIELFGPLGCFAVLDGHGGQFCSRWAADELPRRLGERAALQVECAGTASEEAHHIAQHLSEVVRQMDADLRKHTGPTWACGSTLVALLATRRSLTVANLGDSRAVLCRAGVALPLSRDHKPKSAVERQRILQAGGFIVDGRVNGDLSLSRALGDFRHKSVAKLPPSKQPVSAEPEVRCTVRLKTDDFVLLACDGVWDVISNNDCVAFVCGFLERTPAKSDTAAPAAAPPRSALSDTASGGRTGMQPACAADFGGTAEEVRVATGMICEALLDECLRRGSTDNISAVLVLLDPCLRPTRQLIAAARSTRSPPEALAATSTVPDPGSVEPSGTVPTLAEHSGVEQHCPNNGTSQPEVRLQHEAGRGPERTRPPHWQMPPPPQQSQPQLKGQQLDCQQQRQGEHARNTGVVGGAAALTAPGATVLTRPIRRLLWGAALLSTCLGLAAAQLFHDVAAAPLEPQPLHPLRMRHEHTEVQRTVGALPGTRNP